MIDKIQHTSKHFNRILLTAIAILLFVFLAACVPDRDGLSEDLLNTAKVAEFDSNIIRIWGDARLDEVDPGDLKSGPELKISTKEMSTT